MTVWMKKIYSQTRSITPANTHISPKHKKIKYKTLYEWVTENECLRMNVCMWRIQALNGQNAWANAWVDEWKNGWVLDLQRCGTGFESGDVFEWVNDKTMVCVCDYGWCATGFEYGCVLGLCWCGVGFECGRVLGLCWCVVGFECGTVIGFVGVGFEFQRGWFRVELYWDIGETNS